MKNKRINRLLATTMATTLLVTSLATNSQAMKADTEITFPATNTEITFPATNTEITPPAGTEITFTDKEVYDAAKAAGYDVDKTLENSYSSEKRMSSTRMARSARSSAGINKVKWRSDGGFDLYLSKNSLLLVAGAGIGAITVLLAPIAPTAIPIISSAVSMYAGGNISSGRVFRFKKVMIGKHSCRHVYVKSWSQ